MQSSVPILLLRAADPLFQHSGLAVARTAGRLGIPVYGTSEDRGHPSRRSRYAGRPGVPYRERDEAWLDALLAFGRQRGPALLIPLDDASAVFVARHANALREGFLFPDQPPELSRRLANKREMHDLCHELGIPTPPCRFPRDVAEMRSLAEETELPAVLKRIDGWLPGVDPAAPSVLIARDRAELLDGYGRMESRERPNVLIQEFIPGGSDAVWMFNGYFDRGSRCLVGFTGRKLRQGGPHAGPTTLGECVANEPVAASTRRLAQEVGYRGIIDIGFRYDRRDGLYKLLDVNPRLGSTFRLFVGEDGLDVVRALYLDLTGQPVPPSSARDGRRWMVEPLDLLSAARLRQEGSLGLGAWLGSFRGLREAAWFAADDPAPFLAVGLLGIRYGAGRLAQRSRQKRAA